MILHARGKFGGVNSGYSVSEGLRGVGLYVVNALSEALEVTVWREGLEYTQTYSHGKPVTTLNCVMLPFENKGRQGTRIKFWPDKEGSNGHSFPVYGFSSTANFILTCFFYSLLNMQYSPLIFSLNTTQ